MTRTLIAALALASLGGAAQAQSHLIRNLDLVNNAHAPVAAFFASAAGTNRWNADLLEGHALNTNFFVQLDLDDPSGACRYDFKTVFTDGTSMIRHNVDLCASQTLKLIDP